MKEEKPAETKPQEEEKKEAPKERPRFTGSIKGILTRQQEDNAEANKNLPELQKKLAETIQIHEAKKPYEKPAGDFNNKKHDDKNEAKEDSEDDFDTVEEKKREGRRGGRGGRGGRGALHDGAERHEHGEVKKPTFKKGDKKEGDHHAKKEEQKPKKAEAPVRGPDVVINKNVQDTAF